MVKLEADVPMLRGVGKLEIKPFCVELRFVVVPPFVEETDVFVKFRPQLLVFRLTLLLSVPNKAGISDVNNCCIWAASVLFCKFVFSMVFAIIDFAVLCGTIVFFALI